jgi:hypothetical protein
VLLYGGFAAAGGATLIFETELVDVEGDEDEYEGEPWVEIT